MKSIRVSDLPITPAHGVLLRCLECQGEYSASHGDYFMAPPTRIMQCCGRPLLLMHKRTVYREVEASR